MKFRADIKLKVSLGINEAIYASTFVIKGKSVFCFHE